MAALEQEIASEQVYSDYKLMQDRCAVLEQRRCDLSAYLDEWAELSE
ncbi:MAG: hypothetical protein ACERKO_10885 [Acetanaerobacterium sp.]